MPATIALRLKLMPTSKHYPGESIDQGQFVFGASYTKKVAGGVAFLKSQMLAQI